MLRKVGDQVVNADVPVFPLVHLARKIIRIVLCQNGVKASFKLAFAIFVTPSDRVRLLPKHLDRFLFGVAHHVRRKRLICAQGTLDLVSGRVDKVVLRQTLIIVIILHLESILLIVKVGTTITSLGQIVEFFNLVLISFTSRSLRILIHGAHVAIDVHF